MFYVIFFTVNQMFTFVLIVPIMSNSFNVDFILKNFNLFIFNVKPIVITFKK